MGPLFSDKKIFKVFYMDILGKYASSPGSHVFWWIMTSIILVEDHQKKISPKLY